ncbi:potassium-transporting ATPase subunit KdpC [Sulfobacillus sp. hq2]|uniref:potassium-transporting ATPase subunit KdpC n=1 Tax=Sulfobacillus TaxID=28033 RepID=UPI000CD025AC|nr:potassium-transporting ATPase subunit KdpC [Sulfobacillus sp. hq2]POB12284.1 potassium-transporting ATPase subunit C [Sulfobacillus sp. hq2]
MKFLRPIIVLTVSTWLLVGVAYPLVMTGISQVVFPWQANGSPVRIGTTVVASRHVGQYFDENQYFWGRPSATIPPYNPDASTASNLGPTNRLLISHIVQRIHTLKATIPGLRTNQIPASLVESSGSGLDPDISVQAALIQIPRVAKATGLSPAVLKHLVDSQILGPQFGIFGVQRLNVVQLNLALYKLVHRG